MPENCLLALSDCHLLRTSIRRCSSCTILNREICLNHFVLIEVCSVDILITCLRISTGFEGFLQRDASMRALLSEVSKRSWWTEGVGAKKSLLCQRLRPLFCTPSPMPLKEKGDTFLEGSFGCFWVSVCRQPRPANPFSKPLIFRLRPKGVGEEGVGEKLNRVFSGFFPWQVREWYVPGPSRHHQIPNFLRTLHISNRFFPGFNRVFSGFLKNLEKTWFNFHRPPPWPTPFGGPRILLDRQIRNGRNTVSRVLFRKRELTEFCGKLGEFWEKLGEFALAREKLGEFALARSYGLKGAHWVRSLELSEPRITHWARCLKPCSPNQ